VFDAAADFADWARRAESEIRELIVEDLVHGNYHGASPGAAMPLRREEAEAYVHQLRLRRLDYWETGSCEWHYDSLEPMFDSIGLRRWWSAPRTSPPRLSLVPLNLRRRVEACLERIVPANTSFLGSVAEQILHTYRSVRFDFTSHTKQLLDIAIADTECEVTVGEPQRQFFFREVNATLVAIREEFAVRRD
jgi:hypothetical protein